MFLRALYLFCIFSSFALKAQDYRTYHRAFQRIDQDILSEQLPQAIPRLDSIATDYTFIYAQHCVKALQICCSLGDSIRAAIWLRKAFLRGVPLWLIRGNALTNRVFTYSTCVSTLQDYENLHTHYLGSINQELAQKVDRLMSIDQAYTAKVNAGYWFMRHAWVYLQWRHNNKREAAQLKAIILQHGFPGEQLIGLPAGLQDSAFYYDRKRKEGPYLGEFRAYIMLIHYFSSPRKHMNDLLYSAVVQGQLPSSQYASLNDFISKYGKRKYRNKYYYNAWHTDPDTSHNAAIEERRSIIGLSSIDQQKRVHELVIQRRKSKTGDNSVILEW